MSNDDKALMICQRTSHEPEIESIKINGDCGHELWAANLTVIAAQKLAEERGAQVEYSCLPCVVSRKEMPMPDEKLLQSLAEVLHEDEINEIREAIRGR